MEIRAITDEERKEFYKISQYAFMDWVEKDVTEQKLRWMVNDQCLAVWDKGEMVSSLVNLPLKQNVRGSIKQLSGIGNVATYPECRDKGYIRALFKEAYRDMKNRGQSVSMLQPFKESFYNKVGYVSTNRELKIKFNVSGLQHYLDFIGKDWQIERRTDEKSQKLFMEYTSRQALNHHGMVIYDELQEGWVKGIYEDNLFIFIRYKGEIKAACRYVKKNETITIKEIYWSSLESRKVIFSYFARHRNQVWIIEMYVPMGVNFFSWFYDMRNMYEFKVCEGPWMVRIVDVLEAFDGLKLKGSGKMVWQVKDDMCAWNNGTYLFEVKAGASSFTRLDSAGKYDLIGDIKGFSSLLYGGLSLAETLDRGWLEVKNEEVSRQLEEWLPEKLLYNTFMF
jgi:predicted acetyltransferase